MAAVGISVLIALAYVLFDHQRKTSLRFVESFIALNGIIDQQYPNGASFSPTDLLTEEVLAETGRALGLEAVATTELRKAIVVQFGHPNTAQIRTEWTQAVEEAVDQNVSADALAEINQRYTDRLSRLNNASLSIQVFPDLIGVDEAKALAIAQAIPAAWQKVFVEAYRFTTPPELVPVSGLSPPRDLSSTRNLLEAQQYLFTVAQILSTVREDPRLSSLRSIGSGNAAELQFQLERFNTFLLNPLLGARISAADPFADIRLQQLRRERARIDSLKRATSASIGQLSVLRSRASTDANDSTANPDRSGTVLSLDESGLSSVIDLAQQAQLNQYVIVLFEREWELTKQLADIDLQISQLTSMNASGLDVSDEADVTFVDLSEKIEALFSRLMDEEMQSSGDLYATQVPPQVYSGWDGRSQNTQLLVALSIILGLITGIAVTLLRRTLITDRSAGTATV